MRSILLRLCVCFWVAFTWRTVSAEPCAPSTHAQTTPTDRFTLGTDGTVFDRATGLTWMRCALGQSWDGKTCAGSAKLFSWQDSDWAKDTINLESYAEHSDWRVPVVPELASIVEMGCANTRINATVFPQNPPQLFWSSMEKPGTQDYAYTLSFFKGGASTTPKTEQGAVRLVRGGPWWRPPQTSAARPPNH